jgi:hypothetical protein
MVTLEEGEIECRAIVYSADMEQDAQREFAKIRKELRELTKALATPQVALPPTPTVAPSWWQRNPWAIPTLISAPMALLSVFLSVYVPRLMDHSTKDLKFQIDERIEQKLKDHRFDELVSSVDQMKGELKSISDNLNLLLAKNIKQVAYLSPAQLEKQLPQLNQILDIAAKHRVAVGQDVVVEIHKGLSRVLANGVPAAWDSMLHLASYESAFSLPPKESDGEKVPILNNKMTTSYELGDPPPGDVMPSMQSAVGPNPVPKSAAAHYEPIGKDLNPGNEYGNTFIFIQGGGVVIDGRQIRNVVFSNVHIVYRGGPVEMANVTFVNCRFSVENTSSGQQFLLASIVAPTLAAFHA